MVHNIWKGLIEQLPPRPQGLIERPPPCRPRPPRPHAEPPYASIVNVLTRARELIGNDWEWCQKRKYKADNGTNTPYRKKAVAYCAIGAIEAAAIDVYGDGSAARGWLARVISAGRHAPTVTATDPKRDYMLITRWNDCPRRTYAEVIAAFDKAIENAEHHVVKHNATVAELKLLIRNLEQGSVIDENLNSLPGRAENLCGFVSLVVEHLQIGGLEREDDAAEACATAR